MNRFPISQVTILITYYKGLKYQYAKLNQIRSK